MRRFALIALLTVGVSLLALPASAQEYSPARYRGGSVPLVPSSTVGGGEVLVEVTVNREGTVTGVRPLRTSSPYMGLILSGLRDWTFVPAEEKQPDRTERQPATVLVAAIFRAPTLLGPTLGEPSRDVGVPSEESAFPVGTVMAPFPPLARGTGAVLVEVRVEPTGAVGDATVVHSSPPFDEPALAAARAWTFRPARFRQKPVPAYAYIIFGFPVPIGVSPRR